MPGSSPNQRGIITPNSLCLLTFGGLRIEASPGVRAPEPSPRRLALLALAAAAPRGLSRERVLGILWPEGDEERGRHALAQTVYGLRRDIGHAAVITTATELRLDPAILPSDVGAVLAGLQANDLETVAQRYAGPFLDGFYLADAPEFERWVEQERGRLATAAAHAMQRLAGRYDDSGLRAEAVVLWRRLAAMEPLRGMYAAGYMRALAAAGDRAGALTHARVYTAALARELEAEPEAEVQRLVAEFRRESGSVAIPPAIAANNEPAVEPTHERFPERALEPAPPSGARRRPLRTTALAAIALAAVAGAVVIARWRSTAQPEPPLLAVGVVRDGASDAAAGRGAVLTDMLATSLARISGLRVVANSRLLELIPAGGDAGAATRPGTLPAAARRAGAEEILEGELVTDSLGGLRLNLRRIELASGILRSGYSVRALDRFAAVDSATAAIAAGFGLAAPSDPIADVSTASPVAYRLYDEGLRAYYRYDQPAAYHLMVAALREDSLFAMAAYYAWRVGKDVDQSHGLELQARAQRLAPRAAARERLLILGMIGIQREDPAALAPAESLAIRYPSDPDGQRLYGDVQQTRGDFAAAIAAYRRAFTLDSAASMASAAECRACTTLQRTIGAYMTWDSIPAAERAVRQWERFRPDAPEPVFMLAELRWRAQRWADGAAALARADSLSTNPADYQAARMRAAVRRGQYDEVGRMAAVTMRDPDRSRRSEARWVWLIALRNQGRLREAAELLNEARLPGGETYEPATFDRDEITGAILASESGRHAEAIRRFRVVVAAATAIAEPGHRARGMTWNLTHAAVAYAASGDTAAVHRIADSVEVIGPASLFGRSARLHFFLRGLVLASAGRHAEAVDAYRRAVYSWSDGYTRINYELARSLIALGHSREALPPLRAALRGGIDGSNLYLTRTELHEMMAHAFAAAGERDSARVHYREVVGAWNRADPQFADRVSSASAWMAANTKGSKLPPEAPMRP